MNLEQIADECVTRLKEVKPATTTWTQLVGRAMMKAYNLGKQESTESAIREAVREELGNLAADFAVNSLTMGYANKDTWLKAAEHIQSRLSELKSLSNDKIQS